MVKEENLPEGWEIVPLKMVVDFLDKKRVPLSKKERDKINGEYPYYGASGIVDYVNDYIFDDELVLVGEDGQNLISRNKPMAFKASGKIWVNNHAHVLKPLDINIDFLIYQMNLIDYDPFITGSAQPKLNQKKLAEIPIKKPFLKTQQKIVEILEKAEKLKEWRAEADVLTDEYLKSVFLEMFGDPGLNVNKWPVGNLKDSLINVTNGLSRRRKIPENEGQVVLRLKEIRKNKINFRNLNRIPLNEKEKNRYLAEKGDILFIRVNGNKKYVGRCAVFKGFSEDVYFNDHIMRVKIDFNKFNPIFLAYLINSEYGKLQLNKSIRTSAGQYTVNQKGLERMKLYKPPLELQNQFAQIVQKVEQIKAQQKQSKQQINNLFNNLMQKAFKGELTC